MMTLDNCKTLAEVLAYAESTNVAYDNASVALFDALTRSTIDDVDSVTKAKAFALAIRLGFRLNAAPHIDTLKTLADDFFADHAGDKDASRYRVCCDASIVQHYLHVGRYDDALAVIDGMRSYLDDIAFAVWSGDLAAYAAIAHARAGRLNDASRCFVTGSFRSTEAIQAYALGEVAFLEGEYDEAERHFDAAYTAASKSVSNPEWRRLSETQRSQELEKRNGIEQTRPASPWWAANALLRLCNVYKATGERRAYRLVHDLAGVYVEQSGNMFVRDELAMIGHGK